MWVGSPSPGLPSGKLTVCQLEHCPVEIVDFPLRITCWIFPVRYDSHYQRVNLHFPMGVPMVFLYGFLMPSMPVSEFPSPQKKHRLKSSRPSGIHVFGLFFRPKFRGYPHNSYGQTYGCVYVAPCDPFLFLTWCVLMWLIFMLNQAIKIYQHNQVKVKGPVHIPAALPWDDGFIVGDRFEGKNVVWRCLKKFLAQDFLWNNPFPLRCLFLCNNPLKFIVDVVGAPPLYAVLNHGDIVPGRIRVRPMADTPAKNWPGKSPCRSGQFNQGWFTT